MSKVTPAMTASRVTVYDVGPRDGLQNEPEILDVATRVELVRKLVGAGLPAIEVASFVDPRRVPQMAHAEEVVEVAGHIAESNPDVIVLADTIGVAAPGAVRELTARVAALGIPVGGHFHNTRNTGYANALAALDAGASVLDASVGGLGGCPFAPNATGNIATEDLLYALHREGVATGIDLEALVAVAAWLSETLGRQLDGQLYRAGTFPT